MWDESDGLGGWLVVPALAYAFVWLKKRWPAYRQWRREEARQREWETARIRQETRHLKPGIPPTAIYEFVL